MFVCLCKNITDSQIKHCVKGGACSFRDVRTKLGVATQCCKCAIEAKEIVKKEINSLKSIEIKVESPVLVS